MRRVVLIILTWLTCLFSANAQQPTATASQLATHKLDWIRSNGDFPQSGLTEAQIDTAISNRIKRAANASILNSDIEIPIDTAKLLYLGYIHPNRTNIFTSNPIGTVYNNGKKNTPELDTQIHVYKYGNFYFSTESDSAVDQQNVYYAIRAINILQSRYPDAFEEMFTSTMSFPTQTPNYNQWVNSNKAFWIAFNENPEAIASNNTIFLGEGYFQSPNNNIGKYRNVALVNIDSRNIVGNNSNTGSAPIYRRETAWENYHAYMREGLIESIIHEMGHNYIDLAYTYNDRFYKIKNARNDSNFARHAEEIAILNTSISYFTRKGGMANTLSNYYYTNTFDPKIVIINNLGKLDDYASFFSDLTPNSSTTNGNLRTIFRLPLLGK